MAASTKLIRDLEHLLGPTGVLSRTEDLLLYEYDGSVEEARPDCVVFPRRKQDVVEIVKLANRYDVSLVGRGAGTGLSGGALARRGGIVVAFSRMNHILEMDVANQRAVVEPGVVNLDLSRAVEADGLYFAPDPSSQKACTIGGNVAENSGGPHTLAYGVTSNHVTGLELVLPDGEIVRVGGKTIESPGYDLTGLIVGSEGTFGVVTEITVRLSQLPEDVSTLLAIFDNVEDATDSVVDFTARGITPAACEMLDNCMLRAVEDYVHAGFPTDAAGVLLIEVEGVREAAEAQAVEVAEVCTPASCARSAPRKGRARARCCSGKAARSLWRDWTCIALLLCAGRRDPAHEAHRHVTDNRRSRRSITASQLGTSSTRATATYTR